MGPFKALASSASYATITTFALDARLRASTLTTTWSVSPIPSPTVHGDSRTPGFTALEGDIPAMGGGARGATTHLLTVAVVIILIIMDSDIMAMVAMDPVDPVALLAVPGVDSLEEEDQGEHSVVVGVVVEVVHGGGEVQPRGKLDSSNRLVQVAELLNQWRPVLTLNNNSSSSSPSHPVRRREGASFMELDKLCPVSWSHLV